MWAKAATRPRSASLSASGVEAPKKRLMRSCAVKAPLRLIARQGRASNVSHNLQATDWRVGKRFMSRREDHSCALRISGPGLDRRCGRAGVFCPRRAPLVAREKVPASVAPCGCGGGRRVWHCLRLGASSRRGRASSDIRSQATRPAPLRAWIEIANPVELFTIAAPELVKKAKIYTARQHRTGGGRQDILVAGDLNGAGPVLRLVIYHVGKEAAAPAAFFVDLARRAAETGRAITFAAQPTALSTRLGVFEAADLILTQTGSADAPCLGFRLAYTASLRLTGFACGGKSETATTLAPKAKLSCLLDSLELAPQVDDKDLVAFFAARELNDDTACGDAEERRSSWLAAPSDDALGGEQIKAP